MKKDIPFHPVTGVYMAIAREEKEEQEEWAVYIINKNLISLHSLMITSKGYGELLGEKRQTSILRHAIEKLEANSYAKVEPIDPSVFQLTNEFWVSYYILDQLFDKKYIFVQGVVGESTISYIPELDLHGVLLK